MGGFYFTWNLITFVNNYFIFNAQSLQGLVIWNQSEELVIEIWSIIIHDSLKIGYRENDPAWI